MNSIAKTIKGYVWWTYPRGCFHYDVMVTVILLFIFVAPLFIGFNDKPVERTAHLTGVIVTPEGKYGFVCRIEASAVQGESEAEIRDGLVKWLSRLWVRSSSFATKPFGTTRAISSPITCGCGEAWADSQVATACDRLEDTHGSRQCATPFAGSDSYVS